MVRTKVADCKQCPNCRRLKKLLIYRESMRSWPREHSAYAAPHDKDQPLLTISL